jgi:hypothetical protein
MKHPARHRTLTLTLCWLLFGCSDGSRPLAAFDLELVQDLNINTEAQLIERIDSLVLVVDSDVGLYHPGQESSQGVLQIKNADADPSDLELVITTGLVDGRLPRIRLERGNLPDAALDLRVLGLRLGEVGDAPLAEGRVRGLRFTAEPQALRVGFNIRPEFLPPRVVEVLPSDGVSLRECDIPLVVVVFSKPIALDSLLEPGHISFDPGGVVQQIRTDASGLVANVVPTQLQTTSNGEGLGYRLTVSSDVTDTSGLHLDQVPVEAGDQAYSQTFVLPCAASNFPPRPRCGETPDAATDSCGSDRLICADGLCMPNDCTEASCAPGFPCNPETALCELDCNAYGGEVLVCPETRPECSAGGSCIAAAAR